MGRMRKESAFHLSKIILNMPADILGGGEQKTKLKLTLS